MARLRGSIDSSRKNMFPKKKKKCFLRAIAMIVVVLNCTILASAAILPDSPYYLS